MPLSVCSGPGMFCLSVVFLGWIRDGPSSWGRGGGVVIWKQFPTKRKKNAFVSPCVPVLWGSGYKFTLPNQWDYLLGGRAVFLRLICVSVSDYLFYMIMGCAPSSGTAIRACCRGGQPARGKWALLSCSFLFFWGHWPPPCTGAIMCKPHSVPVMHSGSDFWARLVLTADHCTLPLTLSFLGNSFFMEINLFGQRFLLLPFVLFSTEWVDSNSNKWSCVWAGATSLHHLPAVVRVLRVVWRSWGADLGVPGCRSATAGQDAPFPHQNFPQAEAERLLEVSSRVANLQKCHARSRCTCVGGTIYTSQPGASKM